MFSSPPSPFSGLQTKACVVNQTVGGEGKAVGFIYVFLIRI